MKLQAVVVAICALGVALAFSVAALTLSTAVPSHGLNATTLAQRYVADVAKANGVHLDTEKVVAVRQTPTSAIVLIKVSYSIAGYQGKEQRTFRVRLLKAGWYVTTFDST